MSQKEIGEWMIIAGILLGAVMAILDGLISWPVVCILLVVSGFATVVQDEWKR